MIRKRMRAVVGVTPFLVLAPFFAFGCSDASSNDLGSPPASPAAPAGNTGTPAPGSGGGTTSGATSSGTGNPAPGTTDPVDAGGQTGDSGAVATDGAPPDPGTPPGGLTPAQKNKAQMLTSIWENSTTVLQYPYCENIKDGRGYTSGRAGFCSGTGDAIQVVQCFVAALPGSANKLSKYMPALTHIDPNFNRTGNDQGDTSLLDTVGPYCTDWASSVSSSASAAAFKGCQDQIVDNLYYKPAMAQALKWGLTTALTKAELYDASINHGDDGMIELVTQANTDSGNTAQTPPSSPLTQAQESVWLKNFLARRLKLLKGDPTWRDAVDRVVTYEQLRLQGNFDLSAEIRTNAKAVTMYPGQGYKDSGYPDCKISPSGVVSGDAVCTSPTGL